MLFLAGLAYLYCLWSSSSVRMTARRGDVCTTCTACTTVLVIMAERWKAASPYRDIFETLASKTINMICDVERENWLVPGLPALQQNWGGEHGSQTVEEQFEQLPFSEWVENVADMGMCGGVEMLLDGLMGESTVDR